MDMYYHIRITYGGTGDDATTERFTFYSEKDTHEEDFDAAVKEINRLYKENGHFGKRSDVVNHFAKYGFSQTVI